MLICIRYQHFTKYRRQKKWRLRRLFSGEISIEKNGRRWEVFKTNVLVPKTNSVRKEEGATVAATPYLLLSKTVRAVSTVGQDGQRSSMDTFKPSAIKVPLTTTKVLPSTRIAGDFQNSTDWPSKTDETNDTKKCSWVWEQTKKHKNVIKWHK